MNQRWRNSAPSKKGGYNNRHFRDRRGRGQGNYGRNMFGGYGAYNRGGHPQYNNGNQGGHNQNNNDNNNSNNQRSGK